MTAKGEASSNKQPDDQAEKPEVEINATADGISAAERTSINDSDYPYLSKAKVLVVDDSKIIRTMLVKTLKLARARVDGEESGKKGLSALQVAYDAKEPYDLIFTDLTMPEMDGLEFLRIIRSTPAIRKTPVVVASSESQRDMIIECAKYGVAGYIVKPATTKKILEMAEMALANSAEKPVAEGAKLGAGQGISAEDARALASTLKQAALEALKNGVLPSDQILKEPVYAAFIKFLSNRYPDLMG